MANCDKNFNLGENSYLSKISLSSTKESQLIKSRDELREKIRTHLKEKNVKDTTFYRQGSYAHRTIISPLDGDYDIDDGVYMDLSDFEDEPSTQKIHDWIKEAVRDTLKLIQKIKKRVFEQSLRQAIMLISLHIKWKRKMIIVKIIT